MLYGLVGIVDCVKVLASAKIAVTRLHYSHVSICASQARSVSNGGGASGGSVGAAALRAASRRQSAASLLRLLLLWALRHATIGVHSIGSGTRRGVAAALLPTPLPLVVCSWRCCCTVGD